MSLSGERCEACRPDSPMVTRDEEVLLHQEIPNWEIIEVKETRRLRRTFTFNTWMDGVRFAFRIGEAAETSDHHPTISIAWGKVTVTWWTHAIGGLHRNDFIMAARSDEIATQP
jgi:4a-hydroxytetrahydrobiopterin dehydratase